MVSNKIIFLHSKGNQFRYDIKPLLNEFVEESCNYSWIVAFTAIPTNGFGKNKF